MSDLIQTFKDRFNERLVVLNINQAEVARRVSEPPQTISNWLTRGSVPAGKLFKLCDVLECDSKWLLSGAEPATQDKTTRHALIAKEVNRVNKKKLEAAKPSQVAETIAKLIQLPEDSLSAVDNIIDQILFKKNYD